MQLNKYIKILIFTTISIRSFGQDRTDLQAAENLLDLRFTEVKEDSILSGAVDHLHLYQYLHEHDLYNDIPLSLSFDPLLPGTPYDRNQIELRWDIPPAVNRAA